MNCHQVLSGACNSGDQCFAVGSVEGIPFTIIPGAIHGYVKIGSLDCSTDTGKIAAAYGAEVCIFEPTPLIHTAGTTHLVADGPITALSWNLEGTRLLTVLAQTQGEHVSQELNYTFIYVAHPRAVTHLSWRKTSKYMPKGSVGNVLVTSCVDNICRVWAETLLPEDEWGGGCVTSHSRSPPRRQRATHRHKHRFMQRLKHMKTCFHIRRNAQSSKQPGAPIPTLPSTYSAHDFHNQYHATSYTGDKEENEEGSSEHTAHPDGENDGSNGNHSHPSLSNTTSINSIATDVTCTHLPDSLDAKIEALLRDWHQSPDLLFSIHPAGAIRQAQVSFSARIPSAFPLGDATTMCTPAALYHAAAQPLYVRHRTKPIPSAFPLGDATTMCTPAVLYHAAAQPLYVPHRTKPVIPGREENNERKTSIATEDLENQEGDVLDSAPVISMVTNHTNGTLNLWQLTFDDKSKFSQVLSIGHASRASGHRFRVNDITCHPVLPLLLTTSHHNISDDDSAAGGLCSELIMWRVECVGPLGKSGGVSELARVNSPHLSAFSNVAWLPTLLPSDGESLRVFQAVIDARTLLAEIATSERRHKDVLQSTARPGAIIQLHAIADATHDWHNTQLLHVFQEQLITGERTAFDSDASNDSGLDTSDVNTITEAGLEAIVDLRKAAVFNEPFYIVVLERTDGGSTVHMWRLTVSSQADPNGQPLHISAAYSGRIACAYKMGRSFTRPKGASASTANLNPDARFVNLCVCVYECESTGGAEWLLEDTIPLRNVSLPRVGVCADTQIDLSYLNDTSFIAKKQRLNQAMKESINNNRPILRKASSLAAPLFVEEIRWMQLRRIQLKTADGLPPLPMQISWVRDGILVVGMDSEMHPLLDYMPDYGLFEASQMACPVLPQYHPKQLMELLNSGKIRWVKAILAHLVRCIGGTYTGRSSQGDEDSLSRQRGWSRSRTLSVSFAAGATSPLDGVGQDYNELFDGTIQDTDADLDALLLGDEEGVNRRPSMPERQPLSYPVSPAHPHTPARPELARPDASPGSSGYRLHLRRGLR
ncbi:Rabconnectin [Operophtera brumata]|uniref:Rabconnectin n=1 Tax=Operophtera brumata TaxID=104452 RepID=A0A0L7L296_OPEBR|nr:Rabconnectin [Operophtera brumata]